MHSKKLIKGPYVAYCEERITNKDLQHVKWAIKDSMGQLCSLGHTKEEAEKEALRRNIREGFVEQTNVSENKDR
jgi:hypothetical protein